MWRSRSSGGSHRTSLQGPGSRAVLRGVGRSTARVRVLAAPLSGRIRLGPVFSSVPLLGHVTQLRPNKCHPPSFTAHYWNNSLINRLIKTQLHDARQLDGASKRQTISRQAAWAGANTYCSARNTIIQFNKRAETCSGRCC